MGRYIGNACKKTRRIGSDLFLKSRGGVDINNKCKLSTPPGQHGAKRKKTSNYALQLTAKQMIKYMYGVLEKQFKNYYKKSVKSKMITGHVLLQFLERRLDNVVYRMGFACTRAEARQLISHKSIIIKTLSGKESIVSIPSYLVNVGDIIKVKENSRNQLRIKASLKYVKNISFVDWVDVNVEECYGSFNYLPTRDNLPSEINEQLVVELYSK